MIEIIPTVVPASLDDVANAVARYRSFAHTLHIDIANGSFAPNATWMPAKGEQLPEGMEYELHFMIRDPLEVGLVGAQVGAKRLIGHLEAMPGSISHTLAAWRQTGCEAALATLFDTPVASLDPYASQCDAITVMGITAIGVQGLPPDAHAADHIAQMHVRSSDLPIEVDGAVSESNISALVRAGATRLCVGSALATSADPASTFVRLVALAESAVQ